MVKKVDSYDSGIGSQNTLAVMPTGIIDEPRCINDLDELARLIILEVFKPNNEFTVNGYPIEQIVIGGSPTIAEAVNERTPDRIDVTYNQICFRRYLDDTKETGDGYSIPSVKQNKALIGYALYELGKISISSAKELDPKDDDDRAKLTTEVIKNISPERYRRAKKKAQSKRLDRITDDFFDNIPNADHALIICDQQCDYDHLTSHAMNGENKWVKYPTGCDGTVQLLQINAIEDSPISITQAGEFDPRINFDYDPHEISDRTRTLINQWLPPEQQKPAPPEAPTAEANSSSTAASPTT